MRIDELWKSEEELEKEEKEREFESQKEDLLNQRKDNLINDTEVLAEMSTMLFMNNEALSAEIASLKLKVEELENGRQ